MHVQRPNSKTLFHLACALAWAIFALEFLACSSTKAGPTPNPPPKTVQLKTAQPSVETGPTHHSGDTADDTAIWIHPTDPSLSVILGDDKDGGVLAWDLTGKEIQFIDGDKRYNNLDLRYNFPLTGTYSDGTAHSSVALITVVNESDNGLTFYKMNPSTRQVEPAGSHTLARREPYGGCMYRSPVTGKYYFFTTWRSGHVEQVELTASSQGKVTGSSSMRTFDVGGQLEGCVADDELQYFYVGEESKGVWKYGAEPGTGKIKLVDETGRQSRGGLVADVEGLSLYYGGNGRGYLIVSSQGNDRIVFYEREGSNKFLESFTIVANGSIDRVTQTDGLDVTNFPLGSAFPSGLLVVHDHSNEGGRASNHKLVPFERLGLPADTARDPRQQGAPRAEP